jgi:Arc/MetJ-type ribon-helix-helix transcriptional regulator
METPPLTVTVTLTGPVAERVRSAVAAGRFATPEAAVTAAVSEADLAGGPAHLDVDEGTPEGRARLLHLIDEGLAGLDAGERFDGDAVFAELRERVRRRAAGDRH